VHIFSKKNFDNPHYSGGRDWEDGSSVPARAKSSRDLISTNKPGMVYMPVTPATSGSINRRIKVQDHKSDTLFKK
jgi:hypothetical protein